MAIHFYVTLSLFTKHYINCGNTFFQCSSAIYFLTYQRTFVYCTPQFDCFQMDIPCSSEFCSGSQSHNFCYIDPTVPNFPKLTQKSSNSNLFIDVWKLNIVFKMEADAYLCPCFEFTNLLGQNDPQVLVSSLLPRHVFPSLHVLFL